MTSGERIFLTILFTIGILFLMLGYYFYSDAQSFLEKAKSVDGIVVSLQKKDATLRPVVEYVDHNGISRIHYSNWGTNPPAFFIGEKVKILYDPNDPKYPVNTRIKSKFGVWGLSIFFLSLGSIFILVSSLVWYIITYHDGIWFFRKQDRLEFDEKGRLDHNI